MTHPAAEVVHAPSRQGDAWRARRRTRQFYAVITLVLFAMVIRGFWPSYFGQLFNSSVTRPAVMHLHGAYFTGWMVLLLAQVFLIYGGRLRLHRSIGMRIGIAYGVGLLALGLVVTFVAPVLHVQAGDWTIDGAAGFILLPLVDMILFAGFFGAAIVYRNKPETHKRLILMATVAVVFAAVARMGFESNVVFFFVWLSPLFAGIGFDLLTRRSVHPVYLISLAILTVAFARVFFMESEGWLRIGRALMGPFV